MAKQLNFERRLWLLALATGIPGSVIALALLWTGEFSTNSQVTLTVIILGGWLAAAAALVQRVRYPLQTLSNLLAGIREGDFSTRARGARQDDALGEVIQEVNILGETLREQRLGALEATALLRTVMEEIEVVIFTFDDTQRLRLVNRAGEKLLVRTHEQLLGRTAQELGLVECLQGDAARMMTMTFPGGMGRWGMRRTLFRQSGKPHQLLVLTDLSRALRDEERQAWQRLVRVLGHELNNSLAPIKSIAGSLETIAQREPLPEDWREDMQRGLTIISSRAESLTRFMEAYAQIARLPAPQRRALDIGATIRRVTALETRVPITVKAGPAITLSADSDQLEQLLINLLRNAAEAVRETHPANLPPNAITVTWSKTGNDLEIRIDDVGPGLANPGNLFVPFFTTKPKGSGIGLVLCRQIAEAHEGALTLENRSDTTPAAQQGSGCLLGKERACAAGFATRVLLATEAPLYFTFNFLSGSTYQATK